MLSVRRVAWLLACTLPTWTAACVHVESEPVRVRAIVASTRPVPLPSVRDGDHDGVTDAFDACPALPGISSTVVVLNGCPPPGYYDDGLDPRDRDGDGVPDDTDACPDAAAGSADRSTNGCPAPADSDADGIADTVDSCPVDAGPARDAPRFSGCPLAWLEGDRMRLMTNIQFLSGSTELAAESEPVLAAVTTCMAAHSDIGGLRVEGHTDDRGPPLRNQTLGRRRAERVVAWLVAHGAEPARLSADGVGAERPVDTNGTPEGRAANRRVELHVARLAVPEKTAPEAVSP